MGTQLLPQKGSADTSTDTTQFSAHVRCGETAGWIKMPLGMEVHLGPRDLVIDETQLPPSKKNGTAPNFRTMSIVAKRSPISATAEHLSDNFGHLLPRDAAVLERSWES